MHNLFAAILAKGIGRQLKQGLYREYLNRKEDVAVSYKSGGVFYLYASAILYAIL